MQVFITERETGALVNAIITTITIEELPSMQEGWYFNFAKQVRLLKGWSSYALKLENSAGIQGCLIFQLRPSPNNAAPAACYMPFIEVAPHNYGASKQYERVAGCLIAYAYWLSLELGETYNKGILFFEVGEEDPANEEKLIALYEQKYYARRWSNNLLFIDTVGGKALLETYLWNS